MSWVIYESLVHVRGRRLVLVCSRTEWEDLLPAIRANYAILHEGISNEGDAERLARDLGVPKRAA